jgi:hypothetical protein
MCCVNSVLTRTIDEGAIITVTMNAIRREMNNCDDKLYDCTACIPTTVTKTGVDK